jgi:hypothetical protein
MIAVVKPVHCKRVDYGVKESSDWLVFRLGLRQKKFERECRHATPIATRLKMFVGKVAHIPL